MSFRVDTVALKALPDELDRLGGDALAGRAYVNGHTSVIAAGVLNDMMGGHARVVEEVTGWLARVGDRVATPTADAVRAALTHYAEVDAATAARVDAAHPGAEVPENDEGYTYYAYARTPVFGDKAEPVDRLVAIPDYGHDFPYVPHWANATSPAQLSRDLVWTATSFCASVGLLDRGYDPYEDLCKPLVGDWAGFRGCKDVFDHLAEACGDMAMNTHWCARSIEFCWDGNAADRCEAHLFAVVRALDAAVGPLHALGERYAQAAEGMHQLRLVLGEGISSLIDACVACAVSASLAAVTSETVVGGLLFGGVAAFEAVEVYEALSVCLEAVRTAEALAHAYESWTDNFGVIEGGSGLPALPESAPALPGT